MDKKITISKHYYDQLCWADKLCASLYYARIACDIERVKELLEQIDNHWHHSEGN